VSVKMLVSERAERNRENIVQCGVREVCYNVLFDDDSLVNVTISIGRRFGLLSTGKHKYSFSKRNDICTTIL